MTVRNKKCIITNVAFYYNTFDHIYKEDIGDIMPAMDEFKKQREAIKNKSFKEKLDYYWYYYKMHIFIALFVLILVVTTICDIATSRETKFYIAFLNSFSSVFEQDFIEEFEPLTGLDLEKYNVYLDTTFYFNVNEYDEASMNALEKFLTMTSNSEIDVVITDRNIFSNYADNGFFRDLREYLTDEQLEKYADHFYYYDEAVLDREIDYQAIYNQGYVISTDTTERRDPSVMEKPVPVGIFLDDSLKAKLVAEGYYTEAQEVVFGFMGKDENIEYCRLFLDWITASE